jgi:hypothetical protein
MTEKKITDGSSLGSVLGYALSRPKEIAKYGGIGLGAGLVYAALRNIAVQRKLIVELPFTVYNFDICMGAAKEFQFMSTYRDLNKAAFDDALAKTDFVLGLMRCADQNPRAGDARIIADEIKKIYIKLSIFKLSTVGELEAMKQTTKSTKRIMSYLLTLNRNLYPKLQNFSVLPSKNKFHIVFSCTK